jgi:hypothetical protein
MSLSSNSWLQLAHKTAIITGAASGIGEIYFAFQKNLHDFYAIFILEFIF